jgi:hypothetical protein
MVKNKKKRVLEVISRLLPKKGELFRCFLSFSAAVAAVPVPAAVAAVLKLSSRKGCSEVIRKSRFSLQFVLLDTL